MKKKSKERGKRKKKDKKKNEKRESRTYKKNKTSKEKINNKSILSYKQLESNGTLFKIKRKKKVLCGVSG